MNAAPLCSRCHMAASVSVTQFPPLCARCLATRQREDERDRRIARQYDPAATPPLFITGPGGDFRVEHRVCASCKAIFTAVQGGQDCLDLVREAGAAVDVSDHDEHEPDYGGAFDGNQVISDADPGL